MTAQCPCLCGCGRTFRRPKSWPLCKAADARVWATFKATRDPAGDFQVQFSRFYSDRHAVTTAALSGPTSTPAASQMKKPAARR